MVKGTHLFLGRHVFRMSIHFDFFSFLQVSSNLRTRSTSRQAGGKATNLELSTPETHEIPCLINKHILKLWFRLGDIERSPWWETDPKSARLVCKYYEHHGKRGQPGWFRWVCRYWATCVRSQKEDDVQRDVHQFIVFVKSFLSSIVTTKVQYAFVFHSTLPDISLLFLKWWLSVCY